jgi:dienelactone hydrolase
VTGGAGAPPHTEVAEPVWLGGRGAAILGWVSRPHGDAAGTAVVIVAPLGYEYWTAHRTLRALAERLAAAGALVLRYDHPATGDSEGAQTDPALVERWRAAVLTAAGHVRSLGAQRVVLVGMRLGATLALDRAAEAGVTEVAAIAPITSGKRHQRELRMLGIEIPAGVPGYPAGSLAVAGTVLTPETLSGLPSLDPPWPAGAAGAGLVRVALLDRPGRASETLATTLAGAGVQVTCRAVEGLESCLDEPTEYATVPGGLLDAVADWVAEGPMLTPSRSGPPGGPPVAAWRPAAVTRLGSGAEESVERLGRAGWMAVTTRPDRPPKATVVWLNSGSEHHVGPGRAWVEYARALAGRGYASVRADWSGWGESPDLGHAPGRPYDQHAVQETVELVEDLHAAGHPRIVLAGLCAGAWVALRAAPAAAHLAGVAALNPQLYWQPGDPVEADIVAETHVRRQGEIARHRRLARYGVWSALDMAGIRPPAGRQLGWLARHGPPVLALFAEGDDGLGYLEDRLGRQWSRALAGGRVQRQVVAGADHPLHRHWMRPAVLDALHDWLERTVAAPPGA